MFGQILIFSLALSSIQAVSKSVIHSTLRTEIIDLSFRFSVDFRIR